MEKLLATIQKEKVIAIARCVPAAEIVKLAGAILEGGLSLMEVTFDHSRPDGIKNTLASIEMLNRELGGRMNVGAGTVLTPEQVRQAADAGAKYIISPDMREEVICQTKKLGLISIPGAMTPTEVRKAYDTGADLVKLFPASILGPAYIKSIRGPLPFIPLLATGGINPGNIGQYLAAGAAGAGVGGNLVSVELVRKGDFEAIAAVAREYVEAVQEAGRH